jgi:hypothetical protein
MQVSEKSKELKENGIVVIENYLDEQSCDALHDKIKSIIANDELRKCDGEGYTEMANADEPILNRRTGTDEGMLDIFNMNLILDEASSFKNDSFIRDIINEATDDQYTAQNINVYIRESVANPSPYHADSLNNQFKSFLYLTDVDDTSYGPFSYVKGSHDAPLVEKAGTLFLNRMKNNSGAPRAIVPNPESEATHVTGKKGTLIISNQKGYHRAYPQQEGRERVLMTTSYKTSNNQNVSLPLRAADFAARKLS